MTTTADPASLPHARWQSALSIAMEVVLLAMVTLSPWAYGAVHAGFEWYLFLGLGLLLILWGTKSIVARDLTWHRSPVNVCLTGLVLLAVLQITPLPRAVLRVLSPGTVRLYDQLLPAEQESVDADQPADTVPIETGRTVSLEVGSSRRVLMQIAAVLAAFVVVLNNLTGKEFLQHLAWGVFANISLLSIIGIGQRLSSPVQVVYWTYTTLGQVFGPFVNRNHFPFYVNLGVGLGLGLLISRLGKFRVRRRGGYSRSDASAFDLRTWFSRALQDKELPWIMGGLALVSSAVLFSLSRGGVLALLAGLLFWFIVSGYSGKWQLRIWIGLILVMLTLSLSAWLGIDALEKRFDMMVANKGWDGRFDIWSSLPVTVKRFPLFGSGFGTFSSVFPLDQQIVQTQTIDIEFAHNEYLEVLVEGGLIGLGLFVFPMIYLLVRGFKKLPSLPSSTEKALGWGALVGLLTCFIQSTGEFGLHVPAITLLAVVLAAQVTALVEREPDRIVRLGTAGAILGASLCLVFAWVFIDAGWRARSSEAHRWAALRAASDTDPLSREQSLVFWRAAVNDAPRDAMLNMELAQALLSRDVSYTLTTSVAAWSASMSADAAGNPFLPIVFARALQFDKRALSLANRGSSFSQAMYQYVKTRNLGPLLAHPHLVLAMEGPLFRRAETPGKYLRRVELLGQANPEMLYLCGVEEKKSGQSAEAYADWQRSLSFSNQFLPQILDACKQQLSDVELVKLVLPDSPDVLLDVALKLHPDDVSARSPFLDRAITLFPPNDVDPYDLVSKARIHRAANRNEEAEAILRGLIDTYPWESAFRLEYAKFLSARERWPAALSELSIVVSQDPDNHEARTLFDQVYHHLLGRPM